MSTYLISYDLGGPESSTDYQRLITKIKGFGTRARPLESFYMIQTVGLTTTSIRDALLPFLDKNDKLVVLDISSDFWAVTSTISSDVIKWMKDHI